MQNARCLLGIGPRNRPRVRVKRQASRQIEDAVRYPAFTAHSFRQLQRGNRRLSGVRLVCDRPGESKGHPAVVLIVHPAIVGLVVGQLIVLAVGLVVVVDPDIDQSLVSTRRSSLHSEGPRTIGRRGAWSRA